MFVKQHPTEAEKAALEALKEPSKENLNKMVQESLKNARDLCKFILDKCQVKD